MVMSFSLRKSLRSFVAFFSLKMPVLYYFGFKHCCVICEVIRSNAVFECTVIVGEKPVGPDEFSMLCLQ